jgi:hypothetical protein
LSNADSSASPEPRLRPHVDPHRRRCVVQALADCARHPIVPDDAALRAPIKANVPVPLPRRAPPQSQPRPDYQFNVGGGGDTWLNDDNTAPRIRVTSAVVLNQSSSTAK